MALSIATFTRRLPVPLALLALLIPLALLFAVILLTRLSLLLAVIPLTRLSLLLAVILLTRLSLLVLPPVLLLVLVAHLSLLG